MSVSPELIHSAADCLLSEGQEPSLAAVCERLQIAGDDPQVAEQLRDWWLGLRGRLLLTPISDLQQAPEAMARALKILWQDAVREASVQLNRERERLDNSLQDLRKESEGVLDSSRADYASLEANYQRQADKVGDLVNQNKALEAEAAVLKSNLSGEISLRKQTEEKLHDARNDLKRASQSLEDAKRTFDHRLKDEQAHGQELVLKAEAEARHYRNQLEQIRDEAGKKESALVKNIHDLQAELAKREVKIETLQGQVKSLETELKTMRSDTGSQGRQIAQLSAQLLSATNQNKRLEERVKQLESDVKHERQRASLSSSETLRKEAELRQSVKAKEDELIRTKASLSGLQKKLIGQEEQIRRLMTQLRA